jgi:hypothetical protein
MLKKRVYTRIVCVCTRQYRSLSLLDTPSLSLGDQSRGNGGVSLDEKEFRTCFLVTRAFKTFFLKSPNSLGVKNP